MTEESLSSPIKNIAVPSKKFMINTKRKILTVWMTAETNIPLSQWQCSLSQMWLSSSAPERLRKKRRSHANPTIMPTAIL